MCRGMKKISECAAKFLKILQFASILRKFFKNFPYEVCRKIFFNFLVCREPKKGLEALP
jgi:hypothetical protein